MSLNFNYSKVVDHEKLHESADEWHITDALIWGTMFVGIYHITEDTAGEFYARYNLLQRIDGGFLHKGTKPYYITPEDVSRRIGLSTNAQTWTRLQFFKHKLNSRMDDWAIKVTV